MTNIAILALTRRHTKKGLANDCMYADSAVLVPELLKGLPFKFFATSSIDALIHAMESSLSPKGNATLRLFGYKAISMILNGYKEIAARGPEARMDYLEDFLLASNYAGISDGKIADLNQHIAGILGCDTREVYEKLEELLNVLLPKKALHEYGVREEELETFTDSVMTEQGRLMANNFVPLSREQVLEIYRKLY